MKLQRNVIDCCLSAKLVMGKRYYVVLGDRFCFFDNSGCNHISPYARPVMYYYRTGYLGLKVLRKGDYVIDLEFSGPLER